MSINQIHNDYYDPDRYFGKPSDEEGKPKIHWAIRKMVRKMVGSDGLGRFYRAVYKGVDCGPSIGFLIDGRWVYCEDLYHYDREVVFPVRLNVNLKNERRLDDLEVARHCRYFWQHHLITGISVSSIVEGSDAEVPAEVLTDYSTDFESRFWSNVQCVNDEACRLWERDNTQWLWLTAPGGETIECKWTSFDEFVVTDRSELDQEVPLPVIEAAKNVAQYWCCNEDNDDVELIEGWKLRSVCLCD